MPRKKFDFQSVKKMGLSFPGVEESTAYGSPALKVRGNLMACIPTHKSAEAESLAVRVSFEERDELLATDPDVYYVKDHYSNYPVVLVRLSRIDPDALHGLLSMGWNFASKKRASTRRNVTPNAARRSARSGTPDELATRTRSKQRS